MLSFDVEQEGSVSEGNVSPLEQINLSVREEGERERAKRKEKLRHQIF